MHFAVVSKCKLVYFFTLCW